jgi:hypothetical protein
MFDKELLVLIFIPATSPAFCPIANTECPSEQFYGLECSSFWFCGTLKLQFFIFIISIIIF